MGISWVEDLVSEYYKLKGYLVIENEDIVLPKKSNRIVQAHSDIDILAIKENEIIHAECVLFWGPSKKDEPKWKAKLKDNLQKAEEKIKQNLGNQIKIKNVLVVGYKPNNPKEDGPWRRLEVFCSEEDIILIDLNDVIKKLIHNLKKKYPKSKGKVGKHNKLISFLIYLLQNKIDVN